jgi:hypothetical protein
MNVNSKKSAEVTKRIIPWIHENIYPVKWKIVISEAALFLIILLALLLNRSSLGGDQWLVFGLLSFLSVIIWIEKITNGFQRVFFEIIRPIWPVIVTIVLVFAGVYVNQGRDIFRDLGIGQKIWVTLLTVLSAVVLYVSFYLPFWRGIGDKKDDRNQLKPNQSPPNVENVKGDLFLRKWQTVLPTLFILPFFIHVLVQTIKPSYCFRWFEWLGLGIIDMVFVSYVLFGKWPSEDLRDAIAKQRYCRRLHVICLYLLKGRFSKLKSAFSIKKLPINRQAGYFVYKLLTFVPFCFFPVKKSNPSNKQNGLLRAPVAVSFLLLVFGLTLFFIFYSGLLSHPISWLLFASICWTGTVALLRAWTIGHTFHSVFSLIPVVLLLSFSPLRNNHEIRTIPESGAGPAITRETINALYAKYLATHPGIPPIILVSEGGGLRSAYWTGLLLGAMQDGYPEFKSRIFAISTVSGGTVGANMFAALCKYPALDSLGDTLTYQATMDSILSKDFLSPVLAKALFPEVLQRFLPCNLPGISKFADRARALELSFEKAFWKAKNIEGSPRDTLLSDGFKKQHQGQQIPALFINCTVAETGERGILSTVRLDTFAAADIMDSIGDCVDFPWSTAMSLSARFPGVSPGGRVLKNTEVWRHLLDGGYHDNTGLQTAREIVQNIPDSSKPVIIYIHNDADSKKPVKPIRWYNEITEIIFGFWNVRDARAVADLKTFRSERLSKDSLYRFYDFNLDLSDNAVPVGWFLSDSARKLVKAYVERTISCDMDIESGRQMSRLVQNYPGLER